MPASGRASKRIKSFAPELEEIISPAASIQALAEGFDGPLGPSEGPVWWREGRYLLFSDIHNNRRMKREKALGKGSWGTWQDGSNARYLESTIRSQDVIIIAS